MAFPFTVRPLSPNSTVLNPIELTTYRGKPLLKELLRINIPFMSGKLPSEDFLTSKGWTMGVEAIYQQNPTIYLENTQPCSSLWLDGVWQDGFIRGKSLTDWSRSRLLLAFKVKSTINVIGFVQKGAFIKYSMGILYLQSNVKHESHTTHSVAF